MFDPADRHVHLVRCVDYNEKRVKNAVRECFDAFEILPCVYRNNVLIKANLLSAHRPEKAATTHPEVVAAAASLLLEAGAASVTIGDSPGGAFNPTAIKPVYRITGMIDAASKSGAMLNMDFSERVVLSKNNTGIIKNFKLASFVLNPDIIINIAKLKTHTFMRMTAAVKNCYGAVPGLMKAKYHAQIPNREDFAKMLCDLCDTVAPYFSIIDGILGMEGMGPGTGDPKKGNLLIAAQNPYAADLAATSVIGMNSDLVPLIAEAKKRGYIPRSDSELIFTGAPIEKVKVRFAPPQMMRKTGILSLLPGRLRKPVARYIEPYPLINNNSCIGCGICATACPKQIIKIKNKKAIINHNECIKCYCCHEMCRSKAITLKRLLFIPR